MESLRLIDWIAVGSLSLNVLLVLFTRLDRREDKRKSFAEVVVAERIKLAADLLSAFLVRVEQINELAIYTEEIQTGDPEHRDFALRSREQLLFERAPVAIERLNAAFAAAQVGFSRKALAPGTDMILFLQHAMEHGPPFDVKTAREVAASVADALRSEIRVEEAVNYQRSLFGRSRKKAG